MKDGLHLTIYRIAGKFRGIQFSQFSRLSGTPQKLNPRNKKPMLKLLQPAHAQLADGVAIVVGILMRTYNSTSNIENSISHSAIDTADGTISS